MLFSHLKLDANALAKRYSYYGYDSGSGCAPYAFEDPYNRAYLASYCIFGLITFIILIGSFLISRRNTATGRLLGLPFYAALSVQLLEYILSLIELCLQQCDAISNTNDVRFNIAINVIWRIGQILIFSLLLFSLPTYLINLQGRSPRPTQIGYGILLLVLFGLMIASVGLLGYIQDQEFSSNAFYRSTHLLLADYRLLASVSIIDMGIVALVSAHVLFLSTRNKHSPASNPYIPLFCLFTVSWTVLEAVSNIRADLQDKSNNRHELIVFVTLSWFIDLFQTLGFISFLMAATNAQPARDDMMYGTVHQDEAAIVEPYRNRNGVQSGAFNLFRG